MSLHVIVGAGPVGAATARQLADRDEQVRIITRRGGGPDGVPGIERVAADATDVTRLSELATGAVALYNCANPQYHQWLTDWPPLASALLAAAERSGAVLATANNLYGYGPVDGPITEATPLAADASEAAHPGGHVAGRARRTRGRPDPGHRGARQRLHRGELDLQHGPGQAAACRQARLCADSPGRAAQLDVGPRRRADAGHRRDGRSGLGERPGTCRPTPR